MGTAKDLYVAKPERVKSRLDPIFINLGGIMQKIGYLVLTLSIIAGCAKTMQTTQLQHVAKDWCMVIRASQIIPVYPLTEDLQVGDIFLVQHTVDDQHKEYSEQGFLPLNNLISRMDPEGFDNFYDLSFAHENPEIKLPAEWLNPGKGKSWEKAPTANFPTYSFSVKSGAGINIGIPVQSVPIGLSLLGSDAAQGTITISDAKTYGLDTITLYEKNIRAWEKANHAFLLNFAATGGKKNYIRVISRVYLTGRMNVTLTTSEAQSAGLTVGAPKPVELLTIKSAKMKEGVEAATAANYSESLNKINTYINNILTERAEEAAAGMLPGGTVKIVAASSRGVSMEETFKRPLVIGYLGFDMAIGPDGLLGPPIPTHAVLEQKTLPPTRPSAKLQLLGTARLAFTYKIVKDQVKVKDEKAILLKENLDSIGSVAPEQYPVPIFSFKPGTNQLVVSIAPEENLRSDPPAFSDVTKYLGRLRESIKALEQAPKNSIERMNWLEPTRKEMKRANEELDQHRALIDSANKFADQF
jgi:hypothetical protein